jgi:ApaG protein
LNISEIKKKYNLAVSVSVQYIKEQSFPEKSQYVFAYTINLLNRGNVDVKLISRHWLITDADGKVEEVRGPGVVGENPELKPGEDFTYTSGAIIKTPVGSMQGSYQMKAIDGTSFEAEIAAFSLAQPNILH